MLPSELLIYRQSGETLVPKRLPINHHTLALADDQINCFQACLGSSQGELNQKLHDLEGENPDYKVKRGLAHLLKNSFSTFEIVSPLEPQLLRQQVFTHASTTLPIPQNRTHSLETLASNLSLELNREVLPSEIEKGLYADLQDNRILTQFDPLSAIDLLHRYNLSQVQGIFYRASHIILHAHRNDPGEYKLLFRYLKLFQLMAYIEGDADTGFTITIDGPSSLFKASTRYGLAIAKMIPALLHVSKWSIKAQLHYTDSYTKGEKTKRFTLDDSCGLVSHYPKNKTYDSMLEEAFANRWAKLSTEWRLEREVDLVPLPGSVMIPDFRLVHPDGRDFLLEIVGYWRPEYLQKKFYQVRNADIDNLILAVSERLNLEKAGVQFKDVPARVIWFKDKLSPQAVLKLLEG
jgi:predicted nuclease of restriction endonuclease-like RecB superfamily